MEDVYELYVRGTELLESGHNHQATIPLARARDLAPDKTSIREALGRALFGAQRYEEAAEEFQAVIDRAPTNDYALFCLGRSLQMLGRHAEARQPLAQAAGMRPAVTTTASTATCARSRWGRLRGPIPRTKGAASRHPWGRCRAAYRAARARAPDWRRAGAASDADRVGGRAPLRFSTRLIGGHALTGQMAARR